MASQLRVLLHVSLGLLLLTAITSAVKPTSLLAQLEQEKVSDPHFDSLIAEAYGVESAAKLRGIQVALIYPLEADARHNVYVFPARQAAFPAASSIKVILAAAAAREASQSAEDWNLKEGTESLIDVTRRMIKLSDNASANKLVDRYGYYQLGLWLDKLGFAPDELHFARHFGDFNADSDNTCTALGLAKFYLLLAQSGEVQGLANVASLKKLRSILDSAGSGNNAPAYNDRLNGKLPDVRFLHKTGANNDVLADGGIFITRRSSFVLVVLDKTKNKPAMQRLGKRVYELLYDQP